MPSVPGARELPRASVPTSGYERIASLRVGREDLDVGVRLAGPRVTIIVGDRALTASEAEALREALEQVAHVLRRLGDPQHRFDWMCVHGTEGGA